MGPRAHDAQRNPLGALEIATSGVPYFERPLAPAPLPVLAGVVALGIALLYAAVGITDNDWVAIFAGMAVLVSCVAVLDFAGRRDAGRHPDSRYEALHLPGYSSPIKRVLMVATLVALIGWEFATAEPVVNDRYSSPFPYLLAAGFILFLSPQLVAHLALRRFSTKSADDGVRP